MLLMPGVYREVFDSLGMDFEKILQPVKLEELYRLYFDDGKKISIYHRQGKDGGTA